MEASLEEFEDAQTHIITALNMCETTNAGVVIVVMGRIMAELACQANMSKDVLLNGIGQAYDMALAEAKADAGEPH